MSAVEANQTSLSRLAMASWKRKTGELLSRLQPEGALGSCRPCRFSVIELAAGIARRQWIAVAAIDTSSKVIVARTMSKMASRIVDPQGEHAGGRVRARNMEAQRRRQKVACD